MKYLMMILVVAIFALPAMAQDAAEGSDTPPAAEEKPKKPEMSDEGKKLLADVKQIYSKYYEVLLARTKDGQEFDSDTVWNKAIKEAKNTDYKDNLEFFKAMRTMSKKDRVFKKAKAVLINKYAKAHAAQVKKAASEE